MITDSFDDQTKTLIRLEDFYGEQVHLTERCLIIFSHRLHDELLRRFPCRPVAEIGSVNGVTPIWCFELEGRPLAFYLSQLYAETPQFHQRVDTSEIFQLSLFVPAAEVTCTVGP